MRPSDRSAPRMGTFDEESSVKERSGASVRSRAPPGPAGATAKAGFPPSFASAAREAAPIRSTAAAANIQTRMTPSQSVIAGVTPLVPVIRRLFRRVRDRGDRLDVLQSELHGNDEAQGRTVIHAQPPAGEVRREKTLGMSGGPEVDGDVIRVGIARAVEVHGGFDLRPPRPGGRRKRLEELGERKPSPPRDRAPPLDAAEPGDLVSSGKKGSQVRDRKPVRLPRRQSGQLERPAGQVV